MRVGSLAHEGGLSGSPVKNVCLANTTCEYTETRAARMQHSITTKCVETYPRRVCLLG